MKALISLTFIASLALCAASANAATMQAVFTGQATSVRDEFGITGQPIIGSGSVIASTDVRVTVQYNTDFGEASSFPSGAFFLSGGDFNVDPIAFPKGPITSVVMEAYGRNFSVAIGNGSTLGAGAGNVLNMSTRGVSPFDDGSGVTVDFINLWMTVPDTIMPDDFETPFTHTQARTDTFSFAIHGLHPVFDNIASFSGNLDLSSVAVSAVTAPVPLPAGLPLLLAGMGALAWMRRRTSL
ncbi:MAG: VPLPA-CTERM sorting domain-containing protein [Aliishimia sp.]